MTSNRPGLKPGCFALERKFDSKTSKPVNRRANPSAPLLLHAGIPHPGFIVAGGALSLGTVRNSGDHRLEKIRKDSGGKGFAAGPAIQRRKHYAYIHRGAAYADSGNEPGSGEFQANRSSGTQQWQTAFGNRPWN
jgi:hypothetical protein